MDEAMQLQGFLSASKERSSRETVWGVETSKNKLNVLR